jgi:hypothetical protein
MDVSIKSFDVKMDVKKKGVELEIREPHDGDRLGDLIITQAHLIWCEGRTTREHGKKIKWSEFVEIVNGAQKPAKKTAVKKAPAKKTRAKRAAKKAVVEPLALATEPAA